jgi:hypothetical protein
MDHASSGFCGMNSTAMTATKGISSGTHFGVEKSMRAEGLLL